MKNPRRGLVSARVVMRQRRRSSAAALCNLYVIVVASRALFLAREMMPFHREFFPIPLHLWVSCLARALVTHNCAHPMQLGFVRVNHCLSTVASKKDNPVVLITSHGVPLDAHDYPFSQTPRLVGGPSRIGGQEPTRLAFGDWS